MASINDLDNNEKIIGGAGVLLIIFLLFLPWHSVDTPFGSFTRTAVESPNGFYGVLALLVTIVMVAQLGLSKFTSVELPNPPVPWARVHMIGAIVVLALLVLKLLVETDALGFSSYLSVILAGGMTYGAVMLDRASGGAGTTA